VISATGAPNQRIAAGCTELVIQRSSSETIGHASVAAGLTETGVNPAAGVPAAGPSGTIGGGSRRGATSAGNASRTEPRGASASGGSRSGVRVMPFGALRDAAGASTSGRRS
jgi:hypothetical protein